MSNEFVNISDFLRALHTYKWWQVAIELFLIGMVVFWVVRFLRGTRGARMLKGILFVLVFLYVITRLLSSPAIGLMRLEFLYGRFLLFASFAIVVVFQPELRRALMKLGETRLFGGWNQDIDQD